MFLVPPKPGRNKHVPYRRAPDLCRPGPSRGLHKCCFSWTSKSGFQPIFFPFRSFSFFLPVGKDPPVTVPATGPLRSHHRDPSERGSQGHPAPGVPNTLLSERSLSLLSAPALTPRIRLQHTGCPGAFKAFGPTPCWQRRQRAAGEAARGCHQQGLPPQSTRISVPGGFLP